MDADSPISVLIYCKTIDYDNHADRVDRPDSVPTVDERFPGS